MGKIEFMHSEWLDRISEDLGTIVTLGTEFFDILAPSLREFRVPLANGMATAKHKEAPLLTVSQLLFLFGDALSVLSKFVIWSRRHQLLSAV